MSAPHVVQISYDTSLLKPIVVSDTLARQQLYARSLSELSPATRLSLVVLTRDSAAIRQEKDEITIIPCVYEENDSIPSVLQELLGALHRQHPITTLSPQTINEDALGILAFSRDILEKEGRKIRTVAQIHNDVLNEKNNATFQLAERLGDTPYGYLRTIGDLFDGIRVVSKKIGEELASITQHRDIRTIPVPMTILSEHYSPPSPEIRTHSVLYVGRLSPEKGLLDWLSIAKHLLSNDDTLKFHVVGDGPDRSSLQFKVRELGIESQVIFHGALPPSEVASFYLKCKIIMLTSHHEGFCRAALEAQYFRCPVVAFETKGFIDTIKDNCTGFVVKERDAALFAEKVRILLDDEPLRSRFGEAGHLFAKGDFSTSLLANRWGGFLLGKSDIDLAPISSTPHSQNLILTSQKKEKISFPSELSFSRYQWLSSSHHSLYHALQSEALQEVALYGDTLDVGGFKNSPRYREFKHLDKVESINNSSQSTFTHLLHESLPFKDEGYDNVICLDYLNQCDNDVQLIHECFRVLKQGGTFLFVVPFLTRLDEEKNDFHRHSSLWWRTLLTKVGADATTLTIHPLQWDDESHGADVTGWKGDPAYKKWLMQRPLLRARENHEKDVKASALPLGYILFGTRQKTTLQTTARSTSPSSTSYPILHYLMRSQDNEKHRTIAAWLKETSATGSLLDVGARARILAPLIDPTTITYRSADIGEGHEYQIDLETKLPLSDCSFTYVIALDVLEHVEGIHAAFDELARITSYVLIIALPNLASYSHRVRFLNEGHLGTAKYDLLEKHQGDRHRWLTVYGQMNKFIETSASRNGFSIIQVNEEIEGGPSELQAVRDGTIRDGLYTDRCIYFLRRNS
jgi:glycosyltransferase involved in cell wall biosynthesis/SAM-dependent methyltransferase